MWLTLQKSNGPACPRCGCQDTQQFAGGGRDRWGETVIPRWVCQHCGGTFTAEVPKPESNGKTHHVIDETRPRLIVYPLIRCPVDDGGCGSGKTHVYRTKKPVRYHKCLVCGKNFKSVEESE